MGFDRSVRMIELPELIVVVGLWRMAEERERERKKKREEEEEDNKASMKEKKKKKDFNF
jgi:hypothetical protein